MRDLTLITKSPLEINKCLEKIKTVFDEAIGNKDQICFGESPNSLYIWFPSLKKYDPKEVWYEEEETLPSDYEYFTSVTFHLTSISKQVVKLLEPLYPDMIIEGENGNFYSIQEYLIAEFDY